MKRIVHLWSKPQQSIEMGLNARREYEEKYRPESNYDELVSLYQNVLGR